MANETEETKTSPLIPKLSGVRLEIDGEIKTFDLRYDMLASYRIAKEGRKLGDDNDAFMTIALTVKHFLWPRGHGLTSEQILEGISKEQMEYLNAKIRELLALNKIDLKEDEDPTESPGTAGKKNSPMTIGGNSKQALGSVSDLPSPSSGTPPRPN